MGAVMPTWSIIRNEERRLRIDNREERIRTKAFYIWEGCPEGREDAHWHMATELVRPKKATSIRQAGPGRRRERLKIRKLQAAEHYEIAR
jgi:Protein of unknown function (DUF2934)